MRSHPIAEQRRALGKQVVDDYMACAGRQIARNDLLGGCVDVLSEVLKVLKLQGAMFYNGESSSPLESLCSPARTAFRGFAPPRWT